MKKRVFNAAEESPEDLEYEILKALQNVEPGDYGNLDNHGNFFRLRYLTTVPVKIAIIDKLVEEKKIVPIGDGAIGNTYYKIAIEGASHA